MVGGAKHDKSLEVEATKLIELGKDGQAYELFRQAMDRDPDATWPLSGIADILLSNGKIDEACNTLMMAQAKDPYNPYFWKRLSEVRLYKGDFSQGWACAWWAFRYQFNERPIEGFVTARRELKSERVIIAHEGDLSVFICYSRFVPSYIDRVGSLSIAVQSDIIYSARKLLPGISIISLVDLEKSGLDHHLWLPLVALPEVMGVSEPIPPNILICKDELVMGRDNWKKRLESVRPIVGVSLNSGKGEHKSFDIDIPLALLGKIFDMHYQFFVIAAGLNENDRKALKEYDNVDVLDVDVNDPVELSGFIGALDLFVSADSPGAHLSAALGIPTYVLLPFIKSHVWAKREGRPVWYPDAITFSMSSGGNWGNVFSRLKSNMYAMLGGGASHCNNDDHEKNIKNFDMSAYDENGCLKLSFFQKLALIFLSRGFLLPFLAKSIPEKGRGGSGWVNTLDYLISASHPLLALAVSVPSLIVVWVWLFRSSKSGYLARNLWRHGRMMMLLSVFSDLAVHFLYSKDFGGQEAFVVTLANILIIIYIAASSRLKSVFLCFP